MPKRSGPSYVIAGRRHVNALPPRRRHDPVREAGVPHAESGEDNRRYSTLRNLVDSPREELVGVERKDQHSLGLFGLNLVDKGLDFCRLVKRLRLKGRLNAKLLSKLLDEPAALASKAFRVPKRPRPTEPLLTLGPEVHHAKVQGIGDAEGAGADSAADVRIVAEPANPAAMPALAIVMSTSRRVNSPPESCRTQNLHMMNLPVDGKTKWAFAVRVGTLARAATR